MSSDNNNIPANTNSDPIIESADDVKQQLAEILLNDDYSEVQELEVEVPKEPSNNEFPTWLEDVLEKIVELLSAHGGSLNNGIQIGSFVIKILLILALIVFIVWVVKNPKIRHWIDSQSRRTRLKFTGKDTPLPSVLMQNWQDLPPHHKVAEVVKNLIDEGNVRSGLSILYRASLRWLNDNQRLFISPAHTELQCLKQIEHIKNTQQHDSGRYIIQIIECRLPIAYHGSSDYNTQTLKNLADQWDSTLTLTYNAMQTAKGEL